MPGNDKTIDALHRMNKRWDNVENGVKDFMQKQVSGQNPDPQEFMDLMAKQSTTQLGMQAQMNLHEKPMKNILGDVH